MKPGMKLTILLISGVIIWGSIFFAIGCGNNPKERAKSVAEKSFSPVSIVRRLSESRRSASLTACSDVITSLRTNR